MSAYNPLILDAGLTGAPCYVANLTNAKWNPKFPHKINGDIKDGGYIFSIGGQAAFKKAFDTGTDGTNGFILEP